MGQIIPVIPTLVCEYALYRNWLLFPLSLSLLSPLSLRTKIGRLVGTAEENLPWEISSWEWILAKYSGANYERGA